ncbi:MAG: hypothetical protein II369_02315 [Clostridia bacterium]|nr:hypothetical protein [Clostridia bacterium]
MKIALFILFLFPSFPAHAESFEGMHSSKKGFIPFRKSRKFHKFEGRVSKKALLDSNIPLKKADFRLL